MTNNLDFKKPIKLIPNIRKGNLNNPNEYNWGKIAKDSNILKELKIEFNNDRLDCFNKTILKQLKLSNDDIIAERWIASDDKKNPSLATFYNNEIILPFDKVIEKFSKSILGEEHIENFGFKLPPIMKIIETNIDPKLGSFSLRIHPNSKHPTRKSKLKLWLGEGSIYIGCNKDIDEEILEKNISSGILEKDLNIYNLNFKNALLIPPGVMYALRFNAFIYEWQTTPWKEKIDPFDNLCSTVSVYDRTDGKIPKRKNENLKGTFDILKYSDGLNKFIPKSIQHKTMYKDEFGNKILLIAETNEIFIEAFELKTFLEISTEMKGFPIYLAKGQIDVMINNEVIDEIKSGEERFFPKSLGQCTLVSKTNTTSLLYKWYTPFPWMIEPV